MISPGVERWRQRFIEEPIAALEGALTSRISLGQYDRARPSEALRQMLASDEISKADKAMQAWLEQRLNQPLPEDLSPKRYADALVEAFRAIQLLPLPNSRLWCAQRPSELRAWLRNFYQGGSRDPEAAFLVALAHGQTDRKLLFFWHEIIRRGRPEQHVSHALMGLRLMPTNDQGLVERSLPKALLRGLLDYGETLAKTGDKKGKVWLEELDFLTAVYPMSSDVWGKRFREMLQAREASKDVHHWLDSRFKLSAKQNHSTSNQKFLKPPHGRDMEPLLIRMKKDFSGTRPALIAQLDQHRHYAQESGDSYNLVRAFCWLGEQLLERDPAWARELAHEAARWEPSGHHAWSLLARALEAEGDWRRAEAVYWDARRRFPHIAHSHAQLGHALLLHGQEALGEKVFRQAIELFPDNPIPWAELGHSFRYVGKYEQAISVYKEAQSHFNRNPIIASAIADTLIDLNRLDDAKAALQWAEHVVPDDAKNQDILERIQRRLNQAQNGMPTPPRKLQERKEITGGDLRSLSDISGIDLSHALSLGKASLWRRQGDPIQARNELNKIQDGSARLIELGLLLGYEQGWQASADWFDQRWESYAGDGVLRVHRLRAKHRAGESVDWSWEKSQYPELLPVISTEEKGQPPSYRWNLPDDELSEEQKQQSWFCNLAGDEASILRDWVEEDFLTARQVA